MITPSILLLTATIGDIFTTLFGLGVGCYETNPIVSSHGWVALLLSKLGLTLFVVFILRLTRERLGGLAFAPGLVVTAVVFWNALNILAQLVWR